MTYLEERVKIADFNRLWEEVITLPDGSYSRRQTDDEAEREFWKGFMGRKRSYQRDDTAETVMEAVRKLLADCRTASILEIGPGWGNYTMELAKLCGRMTCVDISPEVLSYIDQTAREQEIRHVTGVCSKWETFSSAERYDVVFGYNCFYRMRSLEECFRKMNETAEKMCIAGMNMGFMPPYYMEMKRELGCRLTYGKKDMIYFINVLYAMGIDAGMTVIPLKKKFLYDDLEQMVSGETSRVDAGADWVKDHKEQISQILQNYFRYNEEGKLEYEYSFRGALVYWKPKEQLS